MTPEPYPHVRVSGDARERGRSYGEQARDRVHASIAGYERTFAHYTGWNWPRVRREAAPFEEPVAERHAPSIEHFKAWSQNLGHEHVSTTLTSYGSIGPHRQGELIRSMAGAEGRPENDPKTRALFDQFVQLVEARGRHKGE